MPALTADPTNLTVGSAVVQICPPLGEGASVLIYNNDAGNNVAYVGYSNSLGTTNTTAVQPLTPVVMDARRTLYAFCPTASITLSITPGGSYQAPSPAQIAAQINAQQGLSLHQLDWINITQPPYNADNTGTNTVDAAIAQAQASNPLVPIYCPTGTYRFSAGFTPAVGARFIGDGYNFTTFNLAGSINLNTGSQINDIEFWGMTLSATGCDIFGAPSVGRLRVKYCNLVVNSAGFGIMGAPSGTIVEMEFMHNKETYNGPAGRTVPMWNLTAVTQVNQCVWADNQWFNNGGDTSQYWMLLSNTSAGTVHAENSLRNIVAEHCMGGMVKQMSCQDTSLEKVICWDLTANVTQSLFYVGTNGVISSGIRFQQCNRRGGNFAAGQSDIQLESTVTNIDIDQCLQQAGGTAYTINMGNAAGVHLINLDPSTVITNWADWQFMAARGYQNGWADQGTHGSGRYRWTSDNRVEISGFLQSPAGAPPAGQVIINLPAVYHPSTNRYIPVILNPGGAAPALVVFELATNGNLTIVNAGAANSGYFINPVSLDLGG